MTTVGRRQLMLGNCHIGIGVSADSSAGPALITGAKDGAIRALNGAVPVGPDLAKGSAEAYRTLAVYANVSR